MKLLLAALLVSAAAFTLTARAGLGAPKGPRKDKIASASRKDIKQWQEDVKTLFEVFRRKLLLLALRLESSGRPDEREKARLLRQVLKQSDEGRRTVGVRNRFDGLIRGLSGADVSIDLVLLQHLLKESDELCKELRALIVMLEGGPRADRKEARRRTAALLEQLKELIASQKRVRALTERGRKSNPELRKDQNRVTRETRAVIEPKNAEGKGGGKGAAKSGAGTVRLGAGKGAGAVKILPAKGTGKSGAGKGKPRVGKGGEGGAGDGQPDDNPVKKQIEDASKHQKQAEKKIARGKLDEASDEQGKAIDKLQEARKKLEGLLEQMREEETESLLASLDRRCRFMLALQIEVRDGTVSLDAQVLANPDKKPSLANRARSVRLADTEDRIIKEAEAVLKLLEREGSAVAFAVVFDQVTRDMKVVYNRLNKADTGKVTVSIENDIVDTLKEMVEAIVKAQKGRKPGKPGAKPPAEVTDLVRLLVRIEAAQQRIGKELREEHRKAVDRLLK
jgi:hypothetical protein